MPSEEDGGQGMLAAIRAGVTGDMAVITEPTGLDVVIAHAGAITFKLTVPGRAAHASVRREGVSALDKLQVLVRALEADETARNEAETEPLMTAHGLPYATIIGTVQGGSWPSTVIDKIEVEGRYGVKLGQTWRDAERDLQRCIDDANEGDPFLRDHPATVELTGGKFSSSRVPADHPLPVGLAGVVRGRAGSRPRVPRRALRRGHAPPGPPRRYADGDLRAGRQAPRPLGQRVGLDGRGRGLCPGPRGVAGSRADPA